MGVQHKGRVLGDEKASNDQETASQGTHLYPITLHRVGDHFTSFLEVMLSYV